MFDDRDSRAARPQRIHCKTRAQHALLEFYGEPLSDVVAEVSRYTRRKITIADPSIASAPFGGAMQAGDLEAFVISVKLMGIRAVPSDEDPNEIRLVGPHP